jgi:hypothetical protein
MDEYRFLQLLNDGSNFRGHGTIHALDVVQNDVCLSSLRSLIPTLLTFIR